MTHEEQYAVAISAAKRLLEYFGASTIGDKEDG